MLVRKFQITFFVSLLTLLCAACTTAPAEPEVSGPIQSEPENTLEEAPPMREVDWSLLPTVPEGGADVMWEIQSEPLNYQECLLITSAEGQGRLVVSCLDIATGKLERLMDVATEWAYYPTSAVDFDNQKIYYSAAAYNGESYDLFDNLFVYDMTDGTSTLPR